MKLISISEAAEILGYSVKGLRRIVERSRARCQGTRSPGPTIRFFQAGRGAPIKFRLEWIEEFIEEHTFHPDAAIVKPRQRKNQAVVVRENSGLDRALLDL